MPPIRLFCSALAALLAASRAVRRQSFAALTAGLGTVNGGETPGILPPAQQREAARICAMISRLATITGPLARCLVRCCAAADLLRRAGIPYTIYCGAKPAGRGKLAAHAWLRAGAATVGDNAGNHFAVITKITCTP